MSDVFDSDLDLNINVNDDNEKLIQAADALNKFTTAWNKLAQLPPINLDQKVRLNNPLPQKLLDSIYEPNYSKAQYAAEEAAHWRQVANKYSTQGLHNFRPSSQSISSQYILNKHNNPTATASRMWDLRSQAHMSLEDRVYDQEFTKLREWYMQQAMGVPYTDPRYKFSIPARLPTNPHQYDDNTIEEFQDVQRLMRNDVLKKSDEPPEEDHFEKVRPQLTKASQLIKQKERPLSYSWEGIFEDELALIKDPKKKEALLNMFSEDIAEKMKTPAASSTGKYHPPFAQGEGGLVRHSKAVAQIAAKIAQRYKIPNADEFVGAALLHDMMKFGEKAELEHTTAEHGSLAAAAAKKRGLVGEADLIAPHMGSWYSGAYKNQPKITDVRQRQFNISDFLASRTYAQDYFKWENNKIVDMDFEGLLSRAQSEGDIKWEDYAYAPKPELDALEEFKAKQKKPKPPKKAKKAKKAVDEDDKEEVDKLAIFSKAIDESWKSSVRSVERFTHTLRMAVTTAAALTAAAVKLGVTNTTAGVSMMGRGLPSFVGLTAVDILDNAMRERRASIGQGSIESELAALSTKRGNFSLTGAGDLLPLALAGNIERLMTGDKPMQEVYGEIIDIFTQRVAGTTSVTEKNKLLALVQSNLGGTAAALVDYQVRAGATWSGSGARLSDATGYMNWTEKVLTVNNEMQAQLDKLNDSWKGLWINFQAQFGNKVLDWANTVLQKGVKGGLDQAAVLTMVDSVEKLKTTTTGKLVDWKGTPLLRSYNQQYAMEQAEAAKTNRYATIASLYNNASSSDILSMAYKSGYGDQVAYIQREYGFDKPTMIAKLKEYFKNEATKYLHTETLRRMSTTKSRALERLQNEVFTMPGAVTKTPSGGTLIGYDLQAMGYDTSSLDKIVGLEERKEAYKKFLADIIEKARAEETNVIDLSTASSKRGAESALLMQTLRKQGTHKGFMEKLPTVFDLTNPNMLTNNAVFDMLTGAVNAPGIFTDTVLTDILSTLEGSIKKASDITGQAGAGATVNMNLNFPNATSAKEIELGVTGAAAELPNIMSKGYESMYTER